MSGRLEYKYLVPNSLLDDIRAELRPYVTADPMVARERDGQYTVRSIYYDTPGLRCYDSKIDGLKVRRKFRIRGYGRPADDSLVFLEIKKKYDGFIEKHRAPLLRKNLQRFLASRDIEHITLSGGTAKERRDAERFVYHYYRKGLVPTALVVYDREPFQGRFDPSLRLTFDKALRAATFPSPESLFDENHLEPAMFGAFIFEVKFFRYALPSFMRSIISRYQLMRMALSKYSICLDSRPAMATASPWRDKRAIVASNRSLSVQGQC